ncbi:hypothetical protein [Streptomyces sp. UNOC14_S4]|uniref:hypothetical protein n=1 Tax=Streptomyces sp. UNOC14_S4 TaxID=2872340 RepID=UPI001E547FBA|nr:hypothetical protein [Streptomyces sp. UNOC14_S4]MCC3766048.1 hypothetical protein [Streptomyces sp. UNOC14_S4]
MSSIENTSPVVIGRHYRLRAPEGMGIGFAKLEPGDQVQVYGITPPGERSNPFPDQANIAFLFYDPRIQPGELLERRIACAEPVFLQNFDLIDDSTVMIGQPTHDQHQDAVT